MMVFCVHLVIDQPQTMASGMVRQARLHGPSITSQTARWTHWSRLQIQRVWHLLDEQTDGRRKMFKTVGQVDLAAAQPLLCGEIPL
jgi:hypothetical protein